MVRARRNQVSRRSCGVGSAVQGGSSYLERSVREAVRGLREGVNDQAESLADGGLGNHRPEESGAVCEFPSV